jgi:hypothetical protein
MGAGYTADAVFWKSEIFFAGELDNDFGKSGRRANQLGCLVALSDFGDNVGVEQEFHSSISRQLP